MSWQNRGRWLDWREAWPSLDLNRWAVKETERGEGGRVGGGSGREERGERGGGGLGERTEVWALGCRCYAYNLSSYKSAILCSEKERVKKLSH